MEENKTIIAKKHNIYNIVNNSLGWLCFVVAAVTYLLTIEPTASFWDCPEFISQGAKLEVGHPPGNPIFMLTARFFVTLFGGDIANASIAVNSMSALLSAATILLLFWTITHLVRKILVRDDAKEVSLVQMLLIMGSGVCGALAYTWSDTFWFSAVEGEVYAFSSFCTALVFWLILKWENRADEPHSDRYLVLIAYVIGVSIAVHLLNLLCIPAIVLVFYYRKSQNVTVKGSLISLCVSFVIVALILYGLVPGFVKVAQAFELFFVNTVGLSYNSGVLIYAVIVVAVFILAIHAVYKGTNSTAIKIYTVLVMMLSGLTFITDNGLIWALLVIGCPLLFIVFYSKIPMRVLSVSIISIFVIFIGYSSYALLLIRASANPPMNQNAPDNVFTLSSYLSREQYGKTPLFRGPTFAEELDVRTYGQGENAQSIVMIGSDGTPATTYSDGLLRNSEGGAIDNGKSSYSKVSKKDPSEPDKYVKESYAPDYQYSPDVQMFFPRMYSSDPSHIDGYKSWSGYVNEDLENFTKRVPPQKLNEWIEQRCAPLYEVSPYLTERKPIRLYDDTSEPTTYAWKPSFADNLTYFFNYQLNHMYWRYFMWNFAGRQNDIQGNGEPHLGNWISGIPFIDNARLGDQSMLPDEFSKDNKGHNVFYMLPLLLGLIGLLWQSLYPHRNNPNRGIEQFWVIFFLFFMTGIAIVLYLNQPTGQPRERDYAFAGSFYAFAIWIGMGVAALSVMLNQLFAHKPKTENGKASTEAPVASKTVQYATAGVAVVIGLIVPLQMVSQTWDDHDRSHRYTTRDFGANYLYSLDDNAIIFTNGDNDTFPLWYAQEVEGVRTDVRVVNLSYLSTDWYANQLTHPYYDAAAVDMLAKPTDYAYDRLAFSYIIPNNDTIVPNAMDALKGFYASSPQAYGGHELMILQTPQMVAPVDREAAIKAFGVNPNSSDSIYRLPYLGDIDLAPFKSSSSFGLSKLLSLDIVANSVNDGFKRPVYFATTVPGSFYLNLEPYLAMTGLAYQVTPFYNAPVSPMVDKAYENIVSKYRWGGLDDTAHNKGLYLDETVRRMVSTVRSSMIQTADDLANSGDAAASEFAIKWAKDNNLPVPANRYDMSRHLLNLMQEKLPEYVTPFDNNIDFLVAQTYLKLYAATGNADDLKRAKAVTDQALKRYAQQARYALSIGNMIKHMGYNEGSARYNFTMFAALSSIIDLAQKLRVNPEANKSDLDMLANLADINYRYYAYPYVFLGGMSYDELTQLANDYGRDGQDFAIGALLTKMLRENGIDPTKYIAACAQKYGLTSEQIKMLHPILRAN